MSNDNAGILFEHYNDSCKITQERVKQRDRYFAYLLAVLILFLFEIYSPQNALEVFSQLISSKLGLTSPIDFAFLDSVLWFVALGLLIKYLQVVIAIERGYTYIHQLESEISSNLKQNCFCRESKSYLDNYPLFLNWACLLFTKVFPGILLLVTTSKIIVEISLTKGKITLLSLVDFAFYLAIIVTLIIYFVSSKEKEASD